MRITFILPGIGISGGVRSTFELANHLQARSHDVNVVYSDLPSWAVPEWRSRELLKEVEENRKGIDPSNSVDWFDLRAKLTKVPTLADRYIPKGDIIIATWWENAYDVDSYGVEKGEKFYIVRHYEAWGGPKDKVDKSYTLGLHKIVTSTWLKNLMEERFGVSASGPLPNGINPDLFYKETEGFESHNPKRIGMLYRRQEWKGMKDGFKAFAIAKKKCPGIQLVLFGETPAGDDIEIIKNIGNVEFHELPYKRELRRIYNSLDIFVFPSHCEGFGNPPMEAKACGVACVTTNVGGVPDYSIPGKTALVSGVRDPNNLAKNMVRLLRNERKRQKIAENGYNYIKGFTWDKTALRLEKVFEDCVAPKPGARQIRDRSS